MCRVLVPKSSSVKLLLGVGCLSIPIVVLVLLFMLLPSIKPFILSTSMFDGFFPSGEYHFTITNSANEPISGAKLSIFETSTQNPAFGYPIDNYDIGEELVSNEAGLIITVHRPRGFEFGGACQQFLVIFTLYCDETPKFDFVITADGYQPIRFSDEVIYKLAYSGNEKGTTSVILDNGQKTQIPVFELVYVLKR